MRGVSNKHCLLPFFIVSYLRHFLAMGHMILLLFAGKLTKLHVEHDNSGFRPGWNLDKIEIINSMTNESTVFKCDQWFDKKKGDGQISRDIYPRD